MQKQFTSIFERKEKVAGQPAQRHEDTVYERG
ncbi:50S ribosomal protein L33 [Fulvimarina pelagi HTCC2506]|uniref:50S ribosomal protein L33 n=1 Tax=Fulvimarina pelagi HTCC2506 TaxID=314231 RepID=Q0FZ71_9HYPH|nr:50S ribosomal protein L33 [Fulvimarina pelagi HTCC2506]